MHNKCINYSNSCCYMSDQKKFNKSFSFHRSMKVWNRPITTWLNIVWYCPKKCDNDILTIFWKWYDIRYHDILSNDMQRVAWVAFICVSSLSLQYPKIVYLPQAVKSLLFPNQKRTQKFWKGDPIFNRKGTKSGSYINEIERDPNFFLSWKH